MRKGGWQRPARLKPPTLPSTLKQPSSLGRGKRGFSKKACLYKISTQEPTGRAVGVEGRGN